MGERGKTYRALLGGAAAMALLAGAAPALAEDLALNIAPQPLGDALNEFAVQSNHAVVFAPGLVAAKTSRQVTTAPTAELALAQLLNGTGLGYRRNGDTFLIVRADADPQSGSAAGGGAEVEALIVTAQKREEDIQDVPIAISAFSQEQLERSQIAGGPDLITQVPNMTFTKTNFSGYSVQLRGIGTQAISATTDPAVAIAFNNTPFIRNRFFEQEFYDLQRVEVLRGPQGTLYGRNATAGVVNLISQKPKFVAEAKLSGDVSNYNSTRLEGMVNIPLVEDTVALRLAGAWTKRDGYAFNEISGAPIDGRDLWSTRLSLRIQPNDRLDANLIWEHFEEDDDRLRSGKQLCKKDVVTQVGDVPITNYFNIRGGGGQGGSVMSGTQATFSQGCKRNSLYAKDSFQRPNGLMLPYYFPLLAIGLPAALTDPYASIVDPSTCNRFVGCDPFLIAAINDQPENLRVIQSTIDPSYRAKTDIAEVQISFDLTDSLTLSSETAYGADFVYSLQDYNRFNTAPGAWSVSNDLQNPYDPSIIPNQAYELGVVDENGVFCDPQLGCSDRLVVVDVSTAKARQFSQELRLQSDFDGPFNFSLGANYLRADSEDKYYIFFNSLSLIAASGTASSGYRLYVPGETDNIDCQFYAYRQGDPNRSYGLTGCIYMDPNPIESVNDQGHNYFLSKNPYKLISYAVFGEASYELAENLKVTGGLRWTVDKKDAPRIPSWVLADSSFGYPVAEVIEQEWREPTGRLAIDWKPRLSFTDETLFYASAAHGYKAGGANPPGYVRAIYGGEGRAEAETPDSATRPRVFDPEFIDAFELGAKNTLAGGRITLNLAGFYYDYEGYQVSEIVDRSAFNRNFDATVWGFELESDWRPFENLRLGFKAGYEKTRIADGEQAIDLMDRTAGDPNWLVVRPFPTYASSCILPTFAYENPDGTIGDVGGIAGGGPGGCEIAYGYGFDPVTAAPYVDLANGGVPSYPPGLDMWNNYNGPGAPFAPHSGYPGWDPSTAPNGGEGIMKPLGGNELPNAPNWTATITADYTIPLPNEWLATLHTDLHWQSESWWRVFNDHEYDKLDEYFTMNLAAIFTNEEAGWKVMAYIKNVTDETAITGAFLNSDDTGLTTNVFLTEPRLYGLRVTKDWTGGPLFGSFGALRDRPYPFTVELGGQIQRHDAPSTPFTPGAASEFEGPLDILPASQNRDLDWGDGREAKVTWRPKSGEWWAALGLRYGKTNGRESDYAEKQTEPVCGWGEPFASYCGVKYGNSLFNRLHKFSVPNTAVSEVVDHEEHEIMDFQVGRDVALGGLSHSAFSFGLRKAHLESTTAITLNGIPDWNVPAGFFTFPPSPPVTRTIYEIEAETQREFEGWGPVISWDAGASLLDIGPGRVDFTWAVSGGALFGERETRLTGAQTERFSSFEFIDPLVYWETGNALASDVLTHTPLSAPPRKSDATVPVAGAELGLAYEVGGFRVGAGYRWERYFDAVDAGFEKEDTRDRTIDGPYFKVSVGFGG